MIGSYRSGRVGGITLADTAIHVLTQAEAFAALRISTADECPNLELILSAVDDGLKLETGHDWAGDATIDPTAKICASIALICAAEGKELPQSYSYKIKQLEAKARE